MFRNPRENAFEGLNAASLPSIGRPPTPPQHSKHPVGRNQSPYFSHSATPTPELARIATKEVASLSSPASQRKGAAKKALIKSVNGRSKVPRPNQSILSFFGKTSPTSATENDSTAQNNDLFFEEPTNPLSKLIAGGRRSRSTSPGCFPGRDDIHGVEQQEDDQRYNELVNAIKRRKVDEDTEDGVVDSTGDNAVSRSLSAHESTQNEYGISRRVSIDGQQAPKQVRHLGGFVDDSSDDEESVSEHNSRSDREEIISTSKPDEEKTSLEGSNTDKECHRRLEESQGDDAHEPSALSLQQVQPSVHIEAVQASVAEVTTPSRPSLNRESTSKYGMEDFNGLDDFDDEFSEGGEEFMERRWMEEQRMLEMGLEDSKSESGEESVVAREDDMPPLEASQAQDDIGSCPICNTPLQGITEAQASTHVNACLDQNPVPLPARQDAQEGNTKNEAFTNASAPKRFQRAAIARPGQGNPFGLTPSGKSGSAFSRLMSGHAEDAAWAAAAANENASRGKPAYQRTCPFYKILPGFYIAVDAFRYGNVEGQNAYFLSHFHSDHYIGLTSSWCHGPVYCSKVTANLVRQQLRVDPKWVVALEFEKKVEVPNTKGVFVTMIPANHCPGSSLYLFEKVISNGLKGPKMNRVLHCGDFRACPVHVTHPLLKPDVIDAVTGQTKQQWIDTCYLDTTYLTPKYAFPSQEDVIGSCADMCVSLSKDIVDASDGWEKAKLERAGSTMTKFLERSNSDMTLIKPEEDVKPATRGRLLVVIGTYSIGKERICLGIAKALKSKIYAPPGKMRICACLEDPELSALLTPHPQEAQVHMQTLMEIRAETLYEYLQIYRGHFSRVVGFRPTGWNYRPPSGRNADNPAVGTVLNSEGWKSRFTMKDLVPQRGSTKESNCFGVPYSEHSSFRELTMFCCALRIGRVIPTVNVGSPRSREKMKGWIERWEIERKKNGLFRVEDGKW